MVSCLYRLRLWLLKRVDLVGAECRLAGSPPHPGQRCYDSQYVHIHAGGSSGFLFRKRLFQMPELMRGPCPRVDVWFVLRWCGGTWGPLRIEASWGSVGRVFWSGGDRFGTVRVRSYVSGVNRGQLRCQLCLGFVTEETGVCLQKWAQEQTKWC